MKNLNIKLTKRQTIGQFLTVMFVLLLMALSARASYTSQELADQMNEWAANGGIEDYSEYTKQLHFGFKLQESQLDMQMVYDRSRNIARCEGWGKPNSVARRNNNPGNLKINGTKRDKHGHTIFNNQVSGRLALNNLIYLHRNASLYQMSRWYATDSDTWYKCIISI